MEYSERMATDIGLVMKNEYNIQKHLEEFASRSTKTELSNEIAEMYYGIINSCLDVIDAASRDHLLNCSIRHSNALADGAMLIRQICLNLGYHVFDSLADDYDLGDGNCLDCEKPIPADLSHCIECQIAMDGPIDAFDMA